MTPKRLSYTQRLMRLFTESSGEWIEAPLVAELGGLCYTKRIHELRTRGVNIENKTERQENGVIHSSYRLVKL